MTSIFNYTRQIFAADIIQLATSIRNSGISFDYCLGIPKGGIPVAMALANELGCRYGTVDEAHRLQELGHIVLIVDDLIDSGETITPWISSGNCIAVLGVKKHAIIPETDLLFLARNFESKWVDFWWESNKDTDSISKSITRVLQYIGENPNRNGLVDTPKRVVKSWTQLYGGYSIDPSSVFKEFDEPVRDDLVIMRNITFSSTCEHHMLPFMGKAHIAYIPKGNKVIGASKMIRLLEIFAHRLQIQERIAQQVCDALEKYLSCEGCACIIEAVHSCILCRGVQNDTAELITPVLRGVFREDGKAALRAELYANIAR